MSILAPQIENRTQLAVLSASSLLPGSHGASKHVQIIDFPVGDQAIDFIRKDCRCNSVVGLMGPLPDGYDDAGCAISEDEASGRMQFRAPETSQLCVLFQSIPLRFQEATFALR